MAAEECSQHGVWGPHELGYAVHDLDVRTTSSATGSGLMVACSSFIPDAANFVEVMTFGFAAPQGIRSSVRLPHYFPCTRVRWMRSGSGKELLATSGDYLRVWSASGELCRLLRHEANPQGVCTPITSVDAAAGSAPSGQSLASCDIYGICALWDVETGAMTQALDLGQPLSDVAFGPDGVLAVVGERGDCFMMDPRQPQDVSVFAPRTRVSGPARIAWGAHRPDLFAVSWQGEAGALALYNGMLRQPKQNPVVIKSTSSAIVSDLCWSHAHPELLACAREDGIVDVWQFPESGLEQAATTPGPGFSWAPRGERGANCTALAMSPEVRPGHHVLVMATMPPGQPGPEGQEANATGGALYLAGLPSPVAKQPLPANAASGGLNLGGGVSPAVLSN